jgi:hypothetical protein
VSKLVNWGHWAVAALFAAAAIDSVWHNVLVTLHGVLRALSGEAVSFYPAYNDALWSVGLWICAWGILKWRRWGHRLALCFAIFGLAVFIIGFLGIREMRFRVEFAIWTFFAIGVTAWLLLPTVRHEFTRRAATA